MRAKIEKIDQFQKESQLGVPGVTPARLDDNRIDPNRVQWSGDINMAEQTPANEHLGQPLKVTPDSALDGVGPSLFSDTTPNRDFSADLLTQPVQPLAFEQAEVEYQKAAATKRRAGEGGGGRSYARAGGSGKRTRRQSQHDVPGSPDRHRLGEIPAANGNSSPMSGIHPLGGEDDAGHENEQEIGNYVPDDDHPDDWGGDVGSDGEDNVNMATAEKQQAGGNGMNAMLAATSRPTASGAK